MRSLKAASLSVARFAVARVVTASVAASMLAATVLVPAAAVAADMVPTVRGPAYVVPAPGYYVVPEPGPVAVTSCYRYGDDGWGWYPCLAGPQPYWRYYDWAWNPRWHHRWYRRPGEPGP
jgi:hypothetical protein